LPDPTAAPPPIEENTKTYYNEHFTANNKIEKYKKENQIK